MLDWANDAADAPNTMSRKASPILNGTPLSGKQVPQRDTENSVNVSSDPAGCVWKFWMNAPEQIVVVKISTSQCASYRLKHFCRNGVAGYILQASGTARRALPSYGAAEPIIKVLEPLD